MKTFFGFTNKSVSEHPINPVNLGLKDNYACTGEDPSVVTYANKTCPLDMGELVTFRSNDVDKVSTSQKIQNPSKVKNGIQYVAKIEEIMRNTDDADNILYDEPIVAYMVVRHQKSGTITNSAVDEVVNRLIGTIQKSDGTTRFGDMMRSALVVTEN